MKESEFQARVLEAAALFGWRRAAFRRVRVQRRDGTVYYETPVQGDGKGFLDVLLLKGKRLIVAELKTDTGRTTPEQELWMRAWCQYGAEVYLWKPSQWDEIVEVLRNG